MVDTLISIAIVAAVILNIVFSVGVIFIQQLLSLSHYSFPTSYDGFGSYTAFGDFRPAEDMVEFASLIAGNKTREITTSILLGNFFEDFWYLPGILFWFLQTEALRSLFIVVWVGFLGCMIVDYRGAWISAAIMIIFGVFDVARVIVLIIAWSLNWWIVTSPGDNSEVTAEFVIMFSETLATIGYVLISGVLMVIIFGRKTAMRRRVSGATYQTEIRSNLGSRKKKKKRKRKKKKKHKYHRIPNKEH